MKRRLLTIAIFLLAGALVNVAVAWGCALWSKTEYSDREQELNPNDQEFEPEDERAFERVLVWRGFGYTAIIKFYRIVNQRSTPTGFSAWSSESIDGRMDLAGWPMRSLVAGDLDYHRPHAFRQGLRLPLCLGWLMPRKRDLPDMPYRTLPIHVVWPGLAVNTVFYAAIFWLLIPGPFVLRRFLRVRRGLCPRCAYPMGASDVCSECGQPSPKRAVV